MDGSEQSTAHQQTPLIYDWRVVSVLLSGSHRVGRKQFPPSEYWAWKLGILESNGLYG